jgi:hypothetical protein
MWGVLRATAVSCHTTEMTNITFGEVWFYPEQSYRMPLHIKLWKTPISTSLYSLKILRALKSVARNSF